MEEEIDNLGAEGLNKEQYEEERENITNSQN